MKLEIKRRKSKICNKIAICLLIWKKCSTFALESCEFSNTGERSPIKQSGAGGLFFDSSSEHLQGWCYHLGGKIARLLFF